MLAAGTDRKLAATSPDCVIVVRIKMPGSQQSLNAVSPAGLKYCKKEYQAGRSPTVTAPMTV